MTIALAHPSPAFRRPRTLSMHPAEWFAYQLAVKPWLRRALIYWATTHFLAIWALAAWGAGVILIRKREPGR